MTGLFSSGIWDNGEEISWCEAGDVLQKKCYPSPNSSHDIHDTMRVCGCYAPIFRRYQWCGWCTRFHSSRFRPPYASIQHDTQASKIVLHLLAQHYNYSCLHGCRNYGCILFCKEIGSWCQPIQALQQQRCRLAKCTWMVCLLWIISHHSPLYCCYYETSPRFAWTICTSHRDYIPLKQKAELKHKALSSPHH